MTTCADCGTGNDLNLSMCRSCGRSLTGDHVDEANAPTIGIPSEPPAPLDRTKPSQQPGSAEHLSSNLTAERPIRNGERSSTSNGVGMAQRSRLTTSARSFVTDEPENPDGEARSRSSEPPLPPLPDGGLAASMPAWLRDPGPLTPLPTAPGPETTTPDPSDPTAFLSEDDLPGWLRRLATTLSRDAEAPRDSPQAIPSPPRVKPPANGAAAPPGSSNGEPPRLAAPRQPVERRTVDQPRTASAPVPGKVTESVQPPRQLSGPPTTTAGPRDEDVAIRSASRRPDRPRWHQVVLALVLAVITVILVYLVTSG